MTRLLALAPLLLAAAACAGTAQDPARRDPFSRPAATAPSLARTADTVDAAPPRLRALILNGASSVADIDGDIVAVGERTRDYRVVRIDARGVLIEHAGKRQLLSMNEKEKQ